MTASNAAQPRACSVLLLLVLGTLAGTCAAKRRQCHLLSGSVQTTRRLSAQVARRSLSEADEGTERLWLLGFDAKQQSQVHSSLIDSGLGTLIHPLGATGPHQSDDHHWLVRATAANVRRLLQQHVEATAAEFPDPLKLSPELQSRLQKSAQLATANVKPGIKTEADAVQARQQQAHPYKATADASSRQQASTASQELDPSLRGQGVLTLSGLAPGVSLEQLVELQASWQFEVAAAVEAATPGQGCSLQLRLDPNVVKVTVCSQGLAAATTWLAAQSQVTFVSVQQRMVPHNIHASATLQAPTLMGSTPPSADIFKGVASDFFPYWKAGLTGEGQVVGIVDTGIDMDSCFFYDPNFLDYQSGNSTTKQPGAPFGLAGNVQQDGIKSYGPISTLPNITIFQNTTARKVVQYVFWSDNIDADGHGTHTSGTIAGSAYGMDPLTQPLTATGIAPMAKLAIFDVGGTNATGSANDYLDMYTGQDPAQMYEIQRQVGARITSNSWGADTYEYAAPDCYLMDAYAWGQDDTLHVFSAGNSGQYTSYLGSSGTVGSPGSCKNVLTVAATENWIPDGKERLTTPFNLLNPNNTTAPVNYTSFMQPNRTKGVTAGSAGVGKMRFYTTDGKFNLLVDGDQKEFLLMTGFDATLQPLVGKPIMLLEATPADACGMGVKLPVNLNSSVLVMGLANKQLPNDSSNQGCYGRESLANIMAAGADAALMFWSDESDIIESASPDMDGQSFPAATTSRDIGLQLEAQLTLGKTVMVEVTMEGTDNSSPIENIAWFSSFASAANYYDAPNADFTNDVRIKPELAAPGYLVSACSDGNFTGKMDQCAAIVYKGTSMACPVVAGAATLARQYFTDGFYPTGRAYGVDAFEPSGPLLKAVLISGTVAMTGISAMTGKPLDPPPSPFQGFGRVDLSSSLPLEDDDKGWRLQVVDKAAFDTDGIEHTYMVRVPNQCSPGCSGAQPLIVTLVYHDYPAFPNNMYVLVNNLDLLVEGPLSDTNTTTNSTVTYWGNDRAGGDFRNNVEKVYIPTPLPGTYRIHVRAMYIFTASRSQRYSLVALGGYRGNLDSPFNPAIANKQARMQKRRATR